MSTASSGIGGSDEVVRIGVEFEAMAYRRLRRGSLDVVSMVVKMECCLEEWMNVHENEEKTVRIWTSVCFMEVFEGIQRLQLVGRYCVCYCVELLRFRERTRSNTV